MVEVTAILGAFIALAYAGWRWGYDSIDGTESAEWERRRAWYGHFVLARVVKDDAERPACAAAHAPHTVAQCRA